MGPANMYVEYGIGKWLGLRLADPPPRFARFVAGELDPLTPTPLPGEPDVTLTAVGAAAAVQGRYSIGNAGDYQECTFGDSAFWLLADGAKFSIPFEKVGSPAEITYDARSDPRRAFNAYVRPILQLRLLNKGAVAVHAAAFSLGHKGILLAGWAESGKTETMLGFVHSGGSFISDKWTILSADGPTISRFPTPITIRGWLLPRIPGLGERLPPLGRYRLRAANRLLGASKPQLIVGGGSWPAVLRYVLAPVLDRSARISVRPSQLFAAREGLTRLWPTETAAPLTTVFFLINTRDRRISVVPASATEIACRLADCAQYERRALMGLYTKFRYAFPDRRNLLIEEAREREVAVVAQALRSVKLFVVETPFPLDPLAVCEAVRRFC